MHRLYFIALLIVFQSCSTTNKQFYFFDHHIAGSKDTTTTEHYVVEQMPVVYASSESIPVAVEEKKKEQTVTTFKKSVARKAVDQKTDSIPDPDLQKKMKRKRIFAVAGFSSSTLGLTALALSTSAPIIPAALITLLLLGGIIVSALGIRNDRKALRRLARIGAWTPIILFAAFALLTLIALIVDYIVPVE